MEWAHDVGSTDGVILMSGVHLSCCQACRRCPTHQASPSLIDIARYFKKEVQPFAHISSMANINNPALPPPEADPVEDPRQIEITYDVSICEDLLRVTRRPDNIALLIAGIPPHPPLQMPAEELFMTNY
ncbi:hypothetical protein MJO29_001355 [Puccinia striiformis f. sp. tritici]|nr:hypothetical protein MJO29_001355 [Puccinia striiformis f. sp. tritici]